jgi:NADH-quinone oxidoreductase subunit J
LEVIGMIPIFFSQLDFANLAMSPWLIAGLVLGTLGLMIVQSATVNGKVSKGALGTGLAAVGGAMAVHLLADQWSLSHLLLLVFVWVAIFAGVGFLSFRQPVYAALSFATVVLSSCVVFILNDAPFIAAATTIVYAGATIIIFLFVLMFAQKSTLQWSDVKLNAPKMSVIAGAALLALLFAAISQLPKAATPTEKEATMVAGLGKTMFTDYLLTIELAGILLLIATIAAIVIAQDDGDETHSAQVAGGHAGSEETYSLKQGTRG